MARERSPQIQEHYPLPRPQVLTKSSGGTRWIPPSTNQRLKSPVLSYYPSISSMFQLTNNHQIRWLSPIFVFPIFVFLRSEADFFCPFVLSRGICWFFLSVVEEQGEEKSRKLWRFLHSRLQQFLLWRLLPRSWVLIWLLCLRCSSRCSFTGFSLGIEGFPFFPGPEFCLW